MLINEILAQIVTFDNISAILFREHADIGWKLEPSILFPDLLSVSEYLRDKLEQYFPLSRDELIDQYS